MGTPQGTPWSRAPHFVISHSVPTFLGQMQTKTTPCTFFLSCHWDKQQWHGKERDYRSALSIFGLWQNSFTNLNLNAKLKNIPHSNVWIQPPWNLSAQHVTSISSPSWAYVKRNVFSPISNGIMDTYGEQWRTKNENDEQGTKIADF